MVSFSLNVHLVQNLGFATNASTSICWGPALCTGQGAVGRGGPPSGRWVGEDSCELLWNSDCRSRDRQVNRKLQHIWKHCHRRRWRCSGSTEGAHQIQPGDRDGLRELPGGRDLGWRRQESRAERTVYFRPCRALCQWLWITQILIRR